MSLSICCKSEVIRRHDREYPLGGAKWGIDYSYDACSSCGEAVFETVEEDED